MFRNTNPTCNERRRSQSRSTNGKRANGVRNQIVCYKCNNLGHIARNYKGPDSQNGTNHRRNALACQLCNNFGHRTKFYRMDRRNLNKNENYRRNN